MAKKRMRQTELPGTEAPSIPEIDTAAEDYRAKRDERQRCTQLEVDAKDALIGAMRKHKVEIYKDQNADPPLVVKLIEGKLNVKVSVAGQETKPDPDHEETEAGSEAAGD